MSGTNIKIYKNDVLLHDCTLCKDTDGRIGWWDAVDGKFHHQEKEPTIREPMWAQYIDTGVSALRKPIVPDTNVAQTNADHIRSMTDEDLAEFLYAVDIREGATDTDGWLDFIKKPYGGDT